jgi:hypothetical protein
MPSKQLGPANRIGPATKKSTKKSIKKWPWRIRFSARSTFAVMRRIAPYVAGAAVAILSIAGLMWRPATVSTTHRANYVVIAGAAGLRWDDINPTDTPTLWALASKDSIGALSVRSARSPTCPLDGWLTLGAGNFAKADAGAVDGVCPTEPPTVTQPDGITGTVTSPSSRVTDSLKTDYGTEIGTLPDSVRCTVAVGPYAAQAAARPYGRVDRYEPSLPADAAKLLSSCTLSIVDLGTVDGTTPAIREAQARAVDAALADVVAARPPDSLLLVAGLSDTDNTSRLHVAIADGPGYNGGWLTSSGTRRQGYLQLVDLAPTALAALGRPETTKVFAGSQAQRVGVRPADPTAAIARLSDEDAEASVQHRVAGWFFAILVGGELLLLCAAIPLLRRARRSVEPPVSEPASPRVVRYVEAFLMAASLTIVVAVLTDIVPWWRSSRPGLLFTVIGAVIAVAVVVVVLWEPWRHIAGRPRTPYSGGALGPLTAVSAIIVAIIAIDVLTGSRLQLNGVAGYSAAEGTRYAGVGAVGLGAFIAGILTFAACVAQLAPRGWRPFVVAAIGAFGVIIAGSPQLGADPGGALALTAGVCVAAAISTGGWLTFTRLMWAAFAGLVVLIGFAVLDLRRPVADRGPVGTLLTEWHAGTAGRAFHQAAAADVVATVTNPLSLLVPLAIIYTMVVMLRPWGGMMRLFGLYPAVRGAMTGMVLAATVAGLLDGVGFTTAGAAAAAALPLITLACLRVLDHADDRTTGLPRPVIAGTESADRLLGMEVREQGRSTPPETAPAETGTAETETAETAPADTEPAKIETVRAAPAETAADVT